MVEYYGTNAIVGTAVAGATGAILGGVVGYSAGKRSSTKAKRKKSSSKNRKKRNNPSKSKGRKLKFGSPAYRRKYLGKRRKQKDPYTAGKRKDTSSRRIRYTKNNQPYIILPNGRAKFISKKTEKQSKKRKGGKY